MKFLFGTKIRFFWVIIPMLAVMTVAIQLNDYSKDLLKFYPLIIFLAGCIIFTFVYLFRAVGLGFDEVRTIGLFSSRERVMINEGKTLTLTLLPKRKILIELFGNDGVLAQLDWLSPGEDGSIPDINLFRAKAVGGKRALKKVLKFYCLDAKTADELVRNDGERYEDDLVVITSSTTEEGYKQVNIKFIDTF